MSLFPEVDKEIEIIKQKEKDDIQQLILISKPYRPSNGSEGGWFECNYCAKCTKDDIDSEKNCMTLLSLYNGYVSRIRELNNKEYVFCLDDSNFNIKDWEKEIKQNSIDTMKGN